jgi:hypothetical protein
VRASSKSILSSIFRSRETGSQAGSAGHKREFLSHQGALSEPDFRVRGFAGQLRHSSRKVVAACRLAVRPWPWPWPSSPAHPATCCAAEPTRDALACVVRVLSKTVCACALSLSFFAVLCAGSARMYLGWVQSASFVLLLFSVLL